MTNELGTASQPSIKESVTTLLSQASQTAGVIKARVGDVTDSLGHASDLLTRYIQANPFKSLALGFGLGYIAMRIRTSPLSKIAVLGSLGYLGRRFARHASAAASAA